MRRNEHICNTLKKNTSTDISTIVESTQNNSLHVTNCKISIVCTTNGKLYTIFTEINYMNKL